MPRVVVIGASAAGLAAAYEAAKAGLPTVLLESNAGPGMSPADTIIDSMAEKCRVSVPDKVVLRRVKGFRVFPPTGEPLVFDSPGVKVDRKAFDEHYISRIEKKGGEVHFGSRVLSLKLGKDGQVREAVAAREGGTRRFKGDYFISAGGSESPWLAPLPFEPVKHPGDVALGIQADMEGIRISPDHFDFYVGARIAPGWKAAVSPLSRTKGSVGVYIRGKRPGAEERYFKDLLKRIPGLKKGRVLKTYRGRDPVAVLPGRLVWNNLLVAGTAGGQAGLPYGMAGGRMAARAVAECEGDLGRLRRYEKEFKRQYLADLANGRRALKVMDGLTDGELDRAFETLARCGITKRRLGRTLDVMSLALSFAFKQPKLFFRASSIWVKHR